LASYLFPSEVIFSENLRDEISGSDDQTTTINLPNRIPIPEIIEDSIESKVGNSITQLVNVISESQNTFVEYFKKLITNISEVSNNLSAFSEGFMSSESSMNKEIHGLGKRIDGLEFVVKEQHKLIEANHKIMKDSVSSLNKIADTAINLTNLEKSIATSDARTQALQQSVDKLVQVYRSAEEDKIRKLVSRIESHVKESDNLKELILNTVAEKN